MARKKSEEGAPLASGGAPVSSPPVDASEPVTDGQEPPAEASPASDEAAALRAEVARLSQQLEVETGEREEWKQRARQMRQRADELHDALEALQGKRDALRTLAVAGTSTGSRRTVAFATKACRVYLGDSLVQILGGEIITDRVRVESLRGDRTFQLFEVDAVQLEHLKLAWEQAVKELRARAAEIGLVVHRDGECCTPTKRRG